jgi:peptidase M42 family hydrolase
MQKLDIDLDYLITTMLELLAIPSPVGLTDEIVHYTCAKLSELDIAHELTRRGAIRAIIKGCSEQPACAVSAHLDTLGAMVKSLKDNGRLGILPIGTWSSRFAEGARVTLFTDSGHYRGTILPLIASGHAFNEQVDTQPIGWQQVELRIDEFSKNQADLETLGINVGDYIAIDPTPEILPNGFISSRHLDDKAGVAALLTALKTIRASGLTLPVDFYPLFTITEEVGSGASAILHGKISEMVGIDIAIPAPGQNSREQGVTIAMQDSSGPYDYHLSRKLIGLCQEFDIENQRDVFPFYHSDSASALEAGNDIRTALIGFGADASHGYERTHISALQSIAELVVLYAQSEPVVARDKRKFGSIEGFPHQLEPEAMHTPDPALPNPADFLDSKDRD